MRITLEIMFRMGGVKFRGYRWENNTLIFEFERMGDVFIQVLSRKRVSVDVEKRPEKVVVELLTKSGVKRYSAVEKNGVYLATEL
ncbi:hypothetical protein [Thermococcus sp.]